MLLLGIAVVSMGGLFFLIAIGTRIAFALMFVGIVGLLLLLGPEAAIGALSSTPYGVIFSYDWAAIPLYILMAELLGSFGIASQLFEMLSKWVGHFRGGLALAAVLACVVFAAASGLSLAAAAVIGVIAVPEMIRRGYNTGLAVGSVVSAAALAMLIPPSVPFIIYGVMTEQSIRSLFMAGVGPGLLLAAFIIVSILVWVRLDPSSGPALSRASWSDRWQTLKLGIPFLALVALVVGTIYAGIATPTESAAVGAFGAFALSVIYKRFAWSGFRQALIRTVETSSMVMILVVGGIVLSLFLIRAGIPAALASAVVDLPVSPWVVLALIQFMLILLGALMDGGSLIVLTTPIVFPLIKSLGFDPIWYGALLVINLELAVVTPPVGLNLYVLKGALPEIGLGTIIRGSAYFYPAMLAVLILAMIFPALVLWLPSTMR